jgi:signal transduction histidine kinase
VGKGGHLSTLPETPWQARRNAATRGSKKALNFREIHRQLEKLQSSQARILKRSKQDVHREAKRRKKAETLLRRREAGFRRLVAKNSKDTLKWRQLEATLRDTICELDAFSYSLSHDIRAPLRTMRSFSQILLQDQGAKISEEGLDHLSRIARAAARLDRLIEDVLIYSRTSREQLRLSRLELEPLINDLINARPNLSIYSRQIQLSPRLKPVLGHPAALTQCLSNLLENAIKFVKPGHTPKVKIYTRRRSRRVRLYVQDSGIGIPREARHQIFELFQGSHHRSDFVGAGVGLAIVRKTAERMGGACGVESSRGKGSLFWVELKAA